MRAARPPAERGRLLPPCAMRSWSRAGILAGQRVEELDDQRHVAWRNRHAELILTHDEYGTLQGGDRSVVEIGGGSCHVAQARHLEHVDILGVAARRHAA